MEKDLSELVRVAKNLHEARNDEFVTASGIAMALETFFGALDRLDVCDNPMKMLDKIQELEKENRALEKQISIYQAALLHSALREAGLL